MYLTVCIVVEVEMRLCDVCLGRGGDETKVSGVLR
jgi:hypothetical protein